MKNASLLLIDTVVTGVYSIITMLEQARGHLPERTYSAVTMFVKPV